MSKSAVNIHRNFMPKEVIQILRSLNYPIDQNKLSQWHKRKLIDSSKAADGSGSRREYRVPKICQIVTFMDNKKNGMTLAESSKIAFHKDTEKIFETIWAHLTSLNAFGIAVLSAEYASIVKSHKPPSDTPLVLGIYARERNGKMRMDHIDEKTDKKLLFAMLATNGRTFTVNLSEVVLRVAKQIINESF
jgi:hypothetical protein